MIETKANNIYFYLAVFKTEILGQLNFKHLIIILLILLPFVLSAHEDRTFTDSYKNVTVRFRTGYTYEEIENARIIGQYAALLCDKMSYDQPVLLDFIHDYGRDYQGKNFSFLNIGSGEYQMIGYYQASYDTSFRDTVHRPIALADTLKHNLSELHKEMHKVKPTGNSEKIVIRQFGFHFTPQHTLKLLHYALTEKSKIASITQKINLLSYLPNMYYSLSSVPKNIVDSITLHPNSVVKSILQQKVYRKKYAENADQIYYSYFSKGNKYYMFTEIKGEEIIIDTLNQIFSFTFIKDQWKSLFVFETTSRFNYYFRSDLSGQFKKSKEHNIPIDEFEYVTDIGVEQQEKGIFIISYYKSIFFPEAKKFQYIKHEDALKAD